MTAVLVGPGGSVKIIDSDGDELQVEPDGSINVNGSGGGGGTVDQGTAGVDPWLVDTGLAQGLTDTQLRASPVPVSGTITANLGTIDGAATEATLAGLAADVANGVAISGSVAVTGPLTDAQLRAVAVPVSGTVAVSGVAGTVNVAVTGTAAVTQSGSWEVSLSAASLAALETINAVQSGTWTVALDAGSLAALETVTVNQGTSPWVVSGTVTATGGLTDAELRASPVEVDGSGVVQPVSGTVAVSNFPATQPISGTVSVVEPVSVDDNGGSLTVDGTVAVSSVGGTVAVSAAALPLPSGAATEATLASLAADVANGVTINQPVAVTDNGGSLTVDGTVAVSSVAGTVVVGDGGGSLTVDGAVTVSGTVTADTELPPAAALADNTATPTAPAVGAFGMAYDGANWDRVRGDSTDGLLVNLGANNDVTVTGTVVANLGTIDGAATAAAQTDKSQFTKITDGTDTALVSAAGALLTDGSATTQPVSGTVGVSGTVAVTQSTSPWVVSGTTNPTTPTALRYGQKVVAVTNTAVQLDAGACVGVVVQALAGNAGNVVIGDSAVTTANGYQLQPGQATGIAIDNVNRVYVNGTAGDGVCWAGS